MDNQKVNKKSRWFEDDEFRLKKQESQRKYYLSKGKEKKLERERKNALAKKLDKCISELSSAGYTITPPVIQC